MIDSKIREQMIRQKERDILWFGSPAGKKESERLAVAAFLRCLSIPAELNEVASIQSGFPDVGFRDAQFEVKEVLDANRKRHDEIKRDLEILRAAQDDSELIERYEPITLTVQGVADRAQLVIANLDMKYPVAQRNSTDLLVYFNLHGLSIDDSYGHDFTLPSPHGWRSISIVGNSWALVVHAESIAPQFIGQYLGKLIRNPDCWG